MRSASSKCDRIPTHRCSARWLSWIILLLHLVSNIFLDLFLQWAFYLHYSSILLQEQRGQLSCRGPSEEVTCGISCLCYFVGAALSPLLWLNYYLFVLVTGSVTWSINRLSYQSHSIHRSEPLSFYLSVRYRSADHRFLALCHFRLRWIHEAIANRSTLVHPATFSASTTTVCGLNGWAVSDTGAQSRLPSSTALLSAVVC